MSDKFTVEIITPDKTILKSETSEVTFLPMKVKWVF